MIFPPKVESLNVNRASHEVRTKQVEFIVSTSALAVLRFYPTVADEVVRGGLGIRGMLMLSPPRHLNRIKNTSKTG